MPDFNLGDLRETARTLREAADADAVCQKWPERREVTLRRHQLLDVADGLEKLLDLVSSRS